jgi:hypothetical protein
MVMRNEETYTIHIEGPDLQALHMQYPDKRTYSIICHQKLKLAENGKQILI